MQSVITSYHIPPSRDGASSIVPRAVSSNRLPISIHRYTRAVTPGGRGNKSAVLARRGDNMDGHGFGNGRMVDEDIITLRLRIKELSLTECEDELPLEWMEWERSYFAYFQKDVCALVGLLQMALMNTRPCVAVGMIAALALSVTTSAALLSLHGMQLLKGMLNALS